MNIAQRKYFILIILLAFFNVSLPAHATNKKKCANLLKITAGKNLLADLSELKSKSSQLLGATDPFLESSSLSEAVRILNKLSHSKTSSGEITTNILGEIRALLRAGNVLADSVKEIAEKLLIVGEAQLSQKQQNNKDLLILKISSEIVIGLYTQLLPPDNEKQDNKEQKSEENKSNEKKDDKDDSNSKAPPPEFAPELPEEYEIKSEKDATSSAAQEKAVFYDFNEAAPYFKQLEYNYISRRQTNYKVIALPLREDEVQPIGTSHLKMRVVTKKARRLKLFIPTGYMPLSPPGLSNVKVSRLANSTYELISDGSEDDITLPMAPIQDEHLAATDIEVLTSPVGVSDNEWPDIVRLHILGKRFSGHLETAQNVTRFIKSNFLYSKKRTETDPVAAVKAGAFKCDMASLIMTSLMRDHFNIPCRIVGGFRASKNKNTAAVHSLLVLPTDPHVWVECNINGRWETFDPTPTKTAPGENNGQTDDSDFVPLEDQESDSSKRPSQPSPAKGQKKDKEENDSISKETKNTGARNIENGLAPDLRLGTLSLKNSLGTSNPLLQDLILSFYRESFTPQLSQGKVIENLSLLSAAKLDSNSQQLKKIMSEALAQLSSSRPAVSQHLRQIVSRIKTNSLSSSYKEFYSSWFRIQAHQAVNNDSTDTDSPMKLLNAFLRAENEFRKLETNSAQNVKQAIGFLRSLPPITRSVILKDYNITQPGNNPPTIRLGEDLQNKKLSSIALIRELYSLTDFITEPVSSPMYMNIKTWNYRNRKGRDFVTMTDATNLMNGISVDPSISRSENFKRGQLIDPRRRQVSKRPSQTGEQEPERVSIVLYDTSGSMDGHPGDFQSGLIAAFADRALSDTTPEGRHLHRLMVMGFDDVVHSALPVTTTSEAQNLIRDYRKRMQNRGAGTDIMAALTEAFEQIEAAQKLKNEPLANANIILMTDGQADIDVNKIKRMRERLDSRTRVQILFVAINDSHTALENFCHSDAKHKANLAKTPFYYFSPQTIEDVITNANENQARPSADVLVTNQPSTAAPQTLIDTLLNIADLADQYESRLALRPLPDIKTMYTAVDTQVNSSVVKSDNRDLRIQINSVRTLLGAKSSEQLARHPAYRFITLTFLRKFSKLSARQLSQLTVEEAEELKHLIREIYAHH